MKSPNSDDEAATPGSEDESAPPPARLPGSAPKPVRAARGARSDGEGTSVTPVPVREVMPSEEGHSANVAAPEPPTARFRLEEAEWIAEVAGATRTGTSPDSGAHLLLLQFRRADGGPEPEREVWAVSRSLEELSLLQLSELLTRARRLEH